MEINLEVKIILEKQLKLQRDTNVFSPRRQIEKENLSLDILNPGASDPEQRSLGAERHLQSRGEWLCIVYWLQLASTITKCLLRDYIHHKTY